MDNFNSTSEFEIERLSNQLSQLDIINIKLDIKPKIIPKNTNINETTAYIKAATS
jgi:hypothetical protein